MRQFRFRKATLGAQRLIGGKTPENGDRGAVRV